MSRWITAEDMRRLNGLPSNDSNPNYAPDSLLQYYIDRGQISVRNHISVMNRDDQMSGSLNGSNTEFYVSNYPIFDNNYDGSINSHDITVYGWGDLDDFNTKTSLSVASVNYLEGRVVMSSAPSSTFEVLTADYRHSRYEIDFTQLELAVAYMSGKIYFEAEYFEIPDRTRVGAQSYTYTERPNIRAWKAYLNAISNIIKNPISSAKRGKS